VRAVDLDTGPNGNVTYWLVKSTDQTVDLFDVEQHTGVVRTADVFDREAQIGVTDYRVTVKAEDHQGQGLGHAKVKAEDMGTPMLAGFCTFRVRIGDRNDNPPVFNLPHYTTSIEESSTVGRRVKQVTVTPQCTATHQPNLTTKNCR